MSSLFPNSDFVMTVLGETPAKMDGVVDAHNHVWISEVPEAIPGSPILNRYEPILKELQDYYTAGGRGIIDCQPGGCGRDARNLASLSERSRVHIVCCTGFHRRRYYSPNAPLWSLDVISLADFFTREIQLSVDETLDQPSPIRAGFIKVAIEASLADTPQAPLEAAAVAAINTGSAIEVHTEKGAYAEKILAFFIRQGVNPQKVILCHLDKRPDFNLHHDLAQAGALLEYDTFYRPQYHPEQNLWPLIMNMISSGLEKSIALATDMADEILWNSMGKGPGLMGLTKIIKNRFELEGVPNQVITQLLGGNILYRLSKPSLNPER